jgi:hypothetical protein
MRISPLLAMVIAGCGPATRSIELAPSSRTAPVGTSPTRLYSAVLPRCPFEDVALITSQPRDLTSSPRVLDGLRSEARRLGGDAVVQVRFLEEDVLTGTVIRFTTPGCNE